MVAQLDPAYRRLGPGRVIRRLASWALFEGRPHTTSGQWANPAIFAFLKTLKAFPGQPRIDRPVFVVGLGRSGTTILGKILSAHEDVAFLNEPKAIWSMVDPATDICGDYVSEGGRFVLRSTDVDDAKKTIAHKLFGRYLKLMGERRLVDKYPELIFRLEFVRSIFGDARFVLITRNGMDACQSISNWSVRKGSTAKRSSAQSSGAQSSGANPQLEDWWGRDNIKWHYLCDELIRSNTRYQDLATLDLDALSSVNRAALEWLITTETGLEQYENDPGDMTLIKFEDLVQDPNGSIKNLLRGCDLPPSQRVLDYAHEVLTPAPDYPALDLHPNIQVHFERVMKRAGY